MRKQRYACYSILLMLLSISTAQAVTITGTSGNDSLSGGAGADQIYGQAGNDTISGNGGNDTLGGGNGNDTINGDAGNDTIYGGNDLDILNGNTGSDTIYGGYGNDELYGGDGDDVLYGGDNDDYIDGGAGNDTLYGGHGSDILVDLLGDNIFVADNGVYEMYSGGPGDFFVVGDSYISTIYPSGTYSTPIGIRGPYNNGRAYVKCPGSCSNLTLVLPDGITIVSTLKTVTYNRSLCEHKISDPDRYKVFVTLSNGFNVYWECFRNPTTNITVNVDTNDEAYWPNWD